MKRTSLALALGLVLIATDSYGQFRAESTDADANGRDMVHLGSLSSGSIYMKPDCSPELADGFKCTVLKPEPEFTDFDNQDLLTFTIPARSVNSLVCFDITPIIDVTYQNGSAVRVIDGRFSARADVVFKSPVLNGTRFNGKLAILSIQYSEVQALAAGEANGKSYHWTRSCGTASVSKDRLIKGGLTAAQATSFFNNPITVTLGADGLGKHVSYMQFAYHVRLYGDRR